MNIDYRDLTNGQRAIAVQRLTALWAFTESGLGGIMHAFQFPFTGLLVGGMAVVMICLIAEIAAHNFRQILTSAVIVLIVKAMVSPHTPFPAYIAVSFQAFIGYGLFRLLGVNFVSILLLSTLAMIESAIQKILILTLFYGDSLWKAMDNMVDFLTSQFNIAPVNGSYWLVGIYLLLYFIGGILIAWLSYRSIKTLYAGNEMQGLGKIQFACPELIPLNSRNKNNKQKLWIMIVFVIALSVVLFLFAPNVKQGWLAVTRTVIWTTSAILVWYVLISPLFTKLIKQVLKKKESKYSGEVLKVLSFLPVLRQLAAAAWKLSKDRGGLRRWHLFITLLIHWSLIYSDTNSLEISPQP